MSIDEKNYSIVWNRVPADWVTFRINGPAPAELPHFVSGAAHVQYLAGECIALDETMLFLGVLHEWLEDIPWLEEDRTAGASIKTPQERYLKRMLYNLCLRSSFDSLEVMVLSLSTRLREQNGRLPALKMLMTGYRLLPRSAAIRGDLIMDVWAVVEASPHVDRECAFQLINRLYEGIEFDRLDEQLFDILDYINFVALSYLGEYQKRNWLFWRVIAKRIRHKELKHRMIRLLNCRPNELASEPVFWSPSVQAV